MEPRRLQVTLGSATVSYLEWTPTRESGHPVLLLHGGGADSAELSWGEVGPALAVAGHRVIAPDHPGFGRSPRPVWRLTQRRLLDTVGEFVEALGLADYTIGGLSLGGGLTIGHVLQHPHRVGRAMLFGSYGLMPRLSDGPSGALFHLATFALLRTGLLSALARAYTRSPAAIERGLRDIVRDPDARTPELVAAVVAETTRGTGLAVFEEWQREQVGWNRLRTDYTQSLASIEVPVLLVQGDHDGGVPLARVRRAAELIPDAELVIVPDAGHWVQRDRAGIVIPAVIDFLRRTDSATTTRRGPA